jgi:uncharacterized protein YceH (UPF0502 family)
MAKDGDLEPRLAALEAVVVELVQRIEKLELAIRGEYPKGLA